MFRRSYLVCATPRSGSSLLCELLKETGVAGRPEEYFEAKIKTGLPPHPGDYLADLPPTGAGIRTNPAPPRAPAYSSLVGLTSYRDHLERTRRLGTTENGVFAAKIMWGHLPDMRTFARSLPEYESLGLYELLERLFDSPRYVRVTRVDKVRQAVSMWRALQTRSWRLDQGHKSSEPLELRYHFGGIDHLVRTFRASDLSWNEFFDTHAIDALSISYEDQLTHDPDTAVHAVLDHIGVKAPDGWRAEVPLERQADELSEEWVAAYHRDAAARAEQEPCPTVGIRP